MKTRYELSKATFWNFWYYKFQEFIMTNGKINLRGANGSGKSVTTQSLITVLLDGNTNPERLDPFGSRQRTIRDTVLGEVDLLPNVIDRIGYVTLELKKGNIVKTIGMGIKASRNKSNFEYWYFIMDGEVGEKDGQFSLSEKKLEDGKMVESPLQIPTLRDQIEKPGLGHVFTKRSDYAEAVNKEFFGFPTMEQYDGLIRLLLQIRSPKLSDQTKPEGVAEVLNNSLPVLSPEELRDATETITSMDIIEKNLEKARAQLSSLKTIRKSYLTYHQRSLSEKAGEYIRAVDDLEKTLKDIDKKKDQIKNAEKKREEIIQDKKEVDNQIKTNMTEKELLSKDESFDVVELQNKETVLKKNFEDQLNKLTPKKEKSDKQILKLGQEYAKATEKLNQAESKLSTITVQLLEYGKDMHYENNEHFIKRFEEDKNEEESFDFQNWNKSVQLFSEFVQKVKEKLEHIQEIKKDIDRKEEEKAKNENAILQLKTDISSYSNDREKEENELALKIDDWSKEITTIAFTKEIIDTLLKNLSYVYETITKNDFFKIVEDEFSTFTKRTTEKIMEIENIIKEKEKTMRQVKQELETWKKDKEIEPFGLSSKKQSFEKLKTEGISFSLFYEAVEFKENVTEEEKKQIQNAISEIGLLQAVFVEEKDIQKAASFVSVIRTSSKKEKNLTMFLQASNDTTIRKQVIEKALEGISLSKVDEHFILTTGEFQSSFTKGISFEIEEGMFIGKAARETMKKEKIDQLTTEMNNLSNEIELNKKKKIS